LNKALAAARGTLIGWLNADDLFPPGALARAAATLQAHPRWLMVYGEGEEFNESSGLKQRYPTLQPKVGLAGFRSHCFICQPTVVFRRSMAMLLGPFDLQWKTAFDFDYWLRAFAVIPDRIGYIPHLQGLTRLHAETITRRQRARVALEATQLLARHFGVADHLGLHYYGLELQLGMAELPPGETLQAHLSELFHQAAPYLEPGGLQFLQRTWLVGRPPAPRSQGPPCRWRPPSGGKPAAAITPFVERPFGVNLIGHAFEVFGIGEDIRMAARALAAAGVPYCVINHPAANGAASTDRSLEPWLRTDPAGGPYAFNLVCMTGLIQARWLRQSGLEPLRERYTFSAWPWETQKWPHPWLPLLQVVDELWPSSSFTASGLAGPAASLKKPLKIMNMAAEIDQPDRLCSPEARGACRSRHGLPADAVLFGYGFDLNSTATRKNPMAALEAFQLAFPLPHLPATFGRELTQHALSGHVALLIKTFPPRSFSAEWEWVRLRAAEDPRIHLIAQSLERSELLALYACCDVFLSLHRSEGYGRGMAEALQLGLDVIATDFGGNTDFCTGPLSHPVRYRQVPIPRGAYPCAEGHQWAEPDLEHAVELCREVASRRWALARDSGGNPCDPSRDPAVLAQYRQHFSFAAAGARYRQRLEELWSERGAIAKRLRWTAGRPLRQ
jgi:glycosyltransferase involved in cell wall biosynthesis